MWVENLKDCFILFCELRNRITDGESIEDISFMYPTTLVPLLSYIENGATINKEVKGYISSISDSINTNPKYVLEKIERGKIPHKMNSMIDALSVNHDKNTLQYFFSELLTNI